MESENKEKSYNSKPNEKSVHHKKEIISKHEHWQHEPQPSMYTITSPDKKETSHTAEYQGVSTTLNACILQNFYQAH